MENKKKVIDITDWKQKKEIEQRQKRREEALKRLLKFAEKLP